jgi:hypothetical protein
MFINTLEFAMPKQATRWGLDDAFRVEEAKAARVAGEKIVHYGMARKPT